MQINETFRTDGYGRRHLGRCESPGPNQNFVEIGSMKYKVYWDNGGDACGTFPYVFDTEEEAQEFAGNWSQERNLEDLGLTLAEVEECGGEECYTAEVIEVEDEPDTEGEGWDPIGDLHKAGLNMGRP